MPGLVLEMGLGGGGGSILEVRGQLAVTGFFVRMATVLEFVQWNRQQQDMDRDRRTVYG